MDERTRVGVRSRREFLRGLTVAGFAGMAIVVSACSDDDGGGGMNPGGCENPVAGTVSTDQAHSHAVRDLCDSDAGGSVTLTLTGGGHTHEASLSAAQVDQVIGGTAVTVTSDGSHTHTVSFN